MLVENGHDVVAHFAELGFDLRAVLADNSEPLLVALGLLLGGLKKSIMSKIRDPETHGVVEENPILFPVTSVSNCCFSYFPKITPTIF